MKNFLDKFVGLVLIALVVLGILSVFSFLFWLDHVRFCY